MRFRTGPRLALLVNAFLAFGCSQDEGPPRATPTVAEVKAQRPLQSQLTDEIPAEQLDAVLDAHFEGLGFIEQYEYAKATPFFRRVHERAPGWTPGAINLAIVLLNDGGNKSESAGKGAAPGAKPLTNFDEALQLLDEVLARAPESLHAHFCRGIILEFLGPDEQHPDRLVRAHEDFKFVAERDPADGHALYRFASSMLDPESLTSPEGARLAGPPQAKALIAAYEAALKANPYLVSTLFKLQAAYAWAGQRDSQKKALDLWKQLNFANNVVGNGDIASDYYGDMGRYARIINPPQSARKEPDPTPPPRFETLTALKVKLAEGCRWVKESDFSEGKGSPLDLIGRARARFGAAVAVFDADGDGKLDLYLAAALFGPKGIRDVLLLNGGDGSFEDRTADYGLAEDRASLGVAAGDFDSDKHVDLFLTGVGDNRLFRNTGKRFEDVSKELKRQGPVAVSLTARWLDIDQDGDLDLCVVNYTSTEHVDEAFTKATPPGVPNAVYRNDGKPSPQAGVPQDGWAPPASESDGKSAKAGLSIALNPWPDAGALLGGDTPHVAVATLDVDDDRDLDLVLAADGEPLHVVLNDRMGRFHGAKAPLEAIKPDALVSGLLVVDLDTDGLADLVVPDSVGPVTAWRNRSRRTGSGDAKLAFESWPCNARQWRAGLLADLDLDGALDALGLPAPSKTQTPIWARNDGRRLDARELALGPDGPSAPAVQGITFADFVGSPLPDLLLVKDGEGPRLAQNLGNGRHWLTIQLGGRWKADHKKHMRTNPHGIGTRVQLEGQGLDVAYDHDSPEAGLAQSVAPIVLGLGQGRGAALVHMRWPDGVLQAELNVPADQVLSIAEENRKQSSCPVLFTWNGTRWSCVGDFLGGGGLGYLVAPGVFGTPDRDESVAIAPEQLRPVDGTLRMAVNEPMSEVSYLDHLELLAVDRPPGVSTTPDERFAPEGPRPTGAILAWRESVGPVHASDLRGRDVTAQLRAWDRDTVDQFQRVSHWIGYAEEHGIVLDFNDRLSRFGPKDRLVLCLAGWVEYPYSQTNYAAATAGVALRPPVLERRRDDGSWEIIEPAAGYPAGLPRMTTLDLTGKLVGPRCVLRLRTNMEVYWDQAFIAVRDPEIALRVTTLPVARAELGYRGYTREASPDGREPLLYDYDHVDPVPLARLEGDLTRYGDVAALLCEDDDQLCLVGPGDELRLEFHAGALPALAEGWSRAYVLRAVGYCKDVDPFTAASDQVGPLPWRGMAAYPYGPAAERPLDAAYRDYLRQYQTRPAGTR
ncbi:MAG: CRTAC1 family protein [Isosphaeraceae bacterium]|nr:CRTAC1 family protein [Isosphaeraceae bacterium]